MGRRLIPCPNCGSLYEGQGKICIKCFKYENKIKLEERKVCPNCRGYKNRQSKMCQKCYIENSERPENYIHQSCHKCGNEFRIHKIHIELGYGKYCSILCSRIGNQNRKKKRNRLVFSCYICEKTFDRRPSEI